MHNVTINIYGDNGVIILGKCYKQPNSKFPCSLCQAVALPFRLGTLSRVLCTLEGQHSRVSWTILSSHMIFYYFMMKSNANRQGLLGLVVRLNILTQLIWIYIPTGVI